MSDWPHETQPEKGAKPKYRIVKPLLDGLKTTFSFVFRKRATIQYPDEKMEMFPRWRGQLHMLKDPKTGLERCVACGLCAVVCPPMAIVIEAGERDDHTKYPVKFEYDMGRCIFCGFCVEACPKAAIAMGHEYELAENSREKLILNKEKLLEPPKEP